MVDFPRLMHNELRAPNKGMLRGEGGGGGREGLPSAIPNVRADCNKVVQNAGDGGRSLLKLDYYLQSACIQGMYID